MLKPFRRAPGAGLRLVAIGLVGGLLAALAPMTSAQADSYPTLGGDGSSWAAPAILQWARDLHTQDGATINFNPDGSALGRSNFTLNQADFAGTDIAYLQQGDPFGGGIESPSVAYSYIPVVAGGTAFMYNLVVGGKKITDLRLSGQTLAQIFTGAITNWNDPRITHDYGAQLPSEPITVITRSDGSGASYQFSAYLAKAYPNIWYPFCHKQGGAGACGPTEFYPGFGNAIPKNGSDQAAGYVASTTYGRGSIAYDEYSYALSDNLPVVKLLNAAGYYTQPTPGNVAIALLKAHINHIPSDINYLTQDLSDVYGGTDPRTYPVSSYSYLLVPRNSRVINGQTYGPPARFTKDSGKGKTLSTYLNYVLCGAQKSAGQLGYSPLPGNLVQGGFAQDEQIPGAIAHPPIATLANCDNPNYSNGNNTLLKSAQFPNACDKVGSPLNCGLNTKGQAIGIGPQRPGTGGQHSTVNQDPATNQTINQNTPNTNTNPNSASGKVTSRSSTGTTKSAAVDPYTGAVKAADGTDDAASPVAQTVDLAGSAGGGALFSVLTAVELLAAVLVPAGLGIWWQRRRRAGA